MAKSSIESLLVRRPSGSLESIRTGWIVSVTGDDQALVDFEHNRLGPVAARTIIERPVTFSGDLRGVPVLLAFDNGDPTLPIIIGFIRKTFGAPMLEDRPTKIILDARDEVVLRSGKSSITITANGDVVTKAERIASRASQTNKLRGASVKIN